MSSLVNVFVEWLYKQALPKNYNDWSLVGEFTSEDHINDQILLLCVKAYAFGDRFIATDFRRAVNNHFEYNLYDKEFGDGLRIAAAYAFKNIPTNRSIVQCLVDNLTDAWAHSDEEFGLHMQEELPCECIRRIMARFRELYHELYTMSDVKVKNWKLVRCYSEHATTEEKDECGCSHMRYDEKIGHGVFEYSSVT